MPERSHSSGAVQRVTAPFTRSPLRSHSLSCDVTRCHRLLRAARARTRPQAARTGTGTTAAATTARARREPAAAIREHRCRAARLRAAGGVRRRLPRRQEVQYPEHAHATYPHCSTTARCSHTSSASKAAAAAARATRSRSGAPCARLTWALLGARRLLDGYS
ncbi:hypothetical protein GGX14DRAFT_484390 [Mycena pura]|uniref:Uncharacterized protein n=1 Tax=Mycena pura TaxID=153505 RepID=A0AAD6XVW3_9AGAR|nr:hypothetical protein GGX14DRAFT_484390 [Mycena pura]